MRRLSMLLPLVALFTGCTYVTTCKNVLFTSDPPGARIFVDGEDTGRTTPANLSVGGLFGSDHEITLTKTGYRPESRWVYQYTEGYTSKWIDGTVDPVTMPSLPLFWTFGDMMTPFAIRGAVVPAQLHVKLYGEDEPRIGFDALAAQAKAAASK